MATRGQYFGPQEAMAARVDVRTADIQRLGGNVGGFQARISAAQTLGGAMIVVLGKTE